MNSSNAAAGSAVKNDDGALVKYLVSHRLQLSLIVFAALVVRSIVTGIRPHAVFNVFDWYSILGLVSILLGVGLRSWAAGTLHKWEQLTTTGPYRLIRNPLYVGSFLMMIGFCVLIGDPVNVLVVAGPILGLYWLKLRREERLLGEKFGNAYTEYTSHTPRMLPRRWPSFGSGEWRLAQWLNNAEYNALAGTLAGLAAIQCWHLGIIHF